MIDPDCICYGSYWDRSHMDRFVLPSVLTSAPNYEETISKEEEEYIKMDINTTKSTFLEYYKNGRLTAPLQSVTISAGRINGKSIATTDIITAIAANLPNKSKAQALGILPKKVIYRDKYTIVIWEDGTKTIVKCSDGDTFDKEKGFLMALTTRMYGKGVMNYLRKELCEKVAKINEFGDQEDKK